MNTIRLNINNVNDKIYVSMPPDLKDEINCGSTDHVIYENGTVFNTDLMNKINEPLDSSHSYRYTCLEDYYKDFDTVKIIYRETMYW